ncbi:hypothetical protein VP1G_08645 [Cytospora mali]|uniref:Uncharacterized protein n=1 Tax=Cytospora mali TaxID=578113 RepID=A0A194VCG6_CYTMA|nr:hypothetical protein VP1G_08645 [Valsa mali var. pyri (nom. inval.)]
MAFWTPPMYCMGCNQGLCDGDCLAKHRNQYGCHNPQCAYHASNPLRPEHDTEATREDNTFTSASTTTSSTTAENRQSEDSNLVYRETITREWWLVNGRLVQVPGEHAISTPTTSTSATTQTTTTQAETGRAEATGANVALAAAGGVILPDIITDEEIEAQARLFAHTNITTTSDALQNPNVKPGQAIDGARNPIAPGARYTSLRKITRRLPDDPEHVLDGIDTAHADLSWTAREDGDDINPTTGEPWLFPKKRGRKVGSNLEDFKEEIEERTKNGQGCKAIAEALVAKGVDTSSRAVARQRMKWGLRQRAPRRMTEQGIANIRKAHLEQAKRMANSDPVPVKRVRIRVMRKAEITRMTKEGMSPAEIAKNLEARGVKLKRGAATIERLRTVWGLVPDSQRNVNNVRQFCRNQAMRLQKEQFENIAKELGIEDVNAWVKSKMDEEVALDARREHAYKLMGDLRPKQIDPGLLRRNAQHLRHLREKNRPHPQGAHFEDPEYSLEGTVAGQHDSSLTPGETGGTGVILEEAAQDDNDLSVDEDELDSVAGDDDGADEERIPTQKPTDAEQSAPTAMEIDQPESTSPQAPLTTQVLNQVSLPSARQTVLAPSTSIPPQTIGQGPISSGNTASNPNFQNGVDYSRNWQNRDLQPGQPIFNGNGQPAIGQQQGRPAAGSPSFHPPSQGWMEPRTLGPMAPRAIAPRPAASRPLAPRPIAPRLPAVNTPPGEAELMAQYGLFPYATFNKAPQKYLTPKGLITTEGYEYLPNAPPPPGTPGSFHQGAPSSQQYPLPQVSKIPAPPLVIPPEEIEKHKDDYKTIEQFQKATQECLEFMAARTNNRPLSDSLTGMPPSLKDVTNAKERLRQAANAMLEVI